MKKQWIIVGFSIIVVVIGVVVFFGFITTRMFNFFDAVKTTSEIIWRKDEPLKLVALSGDSLVLPNSKDERYLLHFWHTGCKPCVEEFDSIQKYKSQVGVRILNISFEDRETVAAFLAKRNWDLEFFVYDTLQSPLEPKVPRFFPTYIDLRKDSIMDVGVGGLEWRDFR